MLNTKRIVPVEKIDLGSLRGEMMKLANISFTKLISADVEGNYSVTGSGSVGNLLADQPAKSIDFVSGVTAAVVYFSAASDFDGFKVAGVAVTPTGTVVADGVTLMTATLSGGAVTVAQVTP